MIRFLCGLLVGLVASVPLLIGPALAQQGPLRIEITEGVIEPLPFAVPDFIPDNTAAADFGKDLSRVIGADLVGTGLFREIPGTAYISPITDFAAPVKYADWKAINAQALIVGAVTVSGSKLTVRFRVYDVFSGAELGNGLQFVGNTGGWRRMAQDRKSVV